MTKLRDDLILIALAVAVGVAAALYARDTKPVLPKSHEEPFLACYTNACFS